MKIETHVSADEWILGCNTTIPSYRQKTELQPNLAKIVALDCDEFCPDQEGRRTQGQAPGAGGTSPCGQGTASQKLETLLYHQAKDRWKCHIQPNLGKPKS